MDKPTNEFKLNTKTQHLSANCILCQAKEAERKRKRRREEDEKEIDTDEDSQIDTPPMTLDELVGLIRAWGSKSNLRISARVDCVELVPDLTADGKAKAAAIAKYLGDEMGLFWG